MRQGYTDEPIIGIKEDLFGVEKYITGLSDYILACNTPMTIAIQGDWGTGKTSIMNMVRDKIDSRCRCVWFNTWEYAQFNMSDELAVSFLKSMVESLTVFDNHTSTLINKSLKTLSAAIKGGTLAAIDMATGGRIADGAEKFLDKISGEEAPDFYCSIKVLKEQFQSQVDLALVQSGKERIVMFVDDLDRLNPEKAVELLEILKTFLDCKNCVFLLAIDYKVVYKGVQLKYNNVLDEEKGRAFFEKIIQLPFKVPVVQYNLFNFVVESLKEAGFSQNLDVNLCIELISHSIGKNPRAIKRLFNSALLLKKINGNHGQEPAEELILFAILCLQFSYEELYNYIISNLSDYDAGEEIIQLTKSDYYSAIDEGSSLRDELMIKDEAELRKLCRFVRSMLKAIDPVNPNLPDEESMNRFVKLLSISTITSAYAVEEHTEDVESMFRYKNREICKGIINTLNKHSKKDQYLVYQARKNQGFWKKQHACIYSNQAVMNGKIGIQINLYTDLETRNTQLVNRLITKDNDLETLKNILHQHEFFTEYDTDLSGYALFKPIRVFNESEYDLIAAEALAYHKEVQNQLAQIEEQPSNFSDIQQVASGLL